MRKKGTHLDETQMKNNNTELEKEKEQSTACDTPHEYTANAQLERTNEKTLSERTNEQWGPIRMEA